ncbi:hypothetical protein [Nocardia abscessus]|uniref:hypothetical protein n=1 Tax=Nocardia abscessus TaxID=120957 RepID=UPI0024579035|nr:hypothetical protein [Nocardia abscessus]
MPTTELTPEHIADLRHWLRSRLSSTRRGKPCPAWLGSESAERTTRIRHTVGEILRQACAVELITPAQKAVWAAAARLAVDAPGQADLATTYGVSTRTVRQWIVDVDLIIADHFAEQLLQKQTPTLGGHIDENIDTVVHLARLSRHLAVEEAAPEELEAIRSFAADRLGGPRVRRVGSKRWVRKRAYDIVADRVNVIRSQPLRPDRFVADQAQKKMVVVPYRLSTDPEVAVGELARAWSNRDREFVPLLANNALEVVRNPDIPAIHRLRALEIISNALRDAENLQAFESAAAWRALAIQVGGPYDYRAWKASSVLIHMMQIHGYTDAARIAQRRQVDSFARVEFPDDNDRAIHVYDRVARLVAIELQRDSSRSTEQAKQALRNLRDLQYANNDGTAETGFVVDRRRVEVALTEFRQQGRGQAVRTHPQFDEAAYRIETAAAGMPPHRALAALDLLLLVDVQRRDWASVRERVNTIRAAVAVPGAPANLVHRLDTHLRWLADRELIRHAMLPIPPDPYRDARFLPHAMASHP